MRADLEGLAAYRAAEPANDAEVATVRRAHEAFVEAIAARVRQPLAGDSALDDPWIAANDRFHDAIIECARNERLERTILELRRSFPTQSDLGALLDDPSLIEDNARQHARVLAAIERREPTRARQGMIDRVRRSGEITAGWFERDRPAETPAR